MADFKVGSFVKSNATGLQAITGVGFTPKAIIFWTSGSEGASGTWGANIRQVVGFTAGPSNSYAVAGTSLDNTATSNTDRRMAAKAITIIRWDGNVDEAALSSFDADGFTLNWTPNGAASNSTHINFLAIGGDGVQAKVVNWTTPTATGNKAVTGAGFQPDLVLHALGPEGVLPVSTAHHYLSFGSMNRSGQQWANGLMSGDAVSPAQTSRVQRTDSCLVTTSTSEVIQERASYVSMDADGFTTNFANVTANARNVASLCLKGVTSKLAAFNKTTAAAPASQSVSGVGFRPKAVMFSHIENPSSASPITSALHGLSATDGTNERSAFQWDGDALNPTDANSMFRNDKVIYGGTRDNGVMIDRSMADATLGNDGFDLTFTTNDAQATEVLYLALGDAGTSTFPTTVTTTSDSDPTAFSNQRKFDRTQNGVLWAFYGTGVNISPSYSTDGGVTWTFAGYVNAGAGNIAADNFSVFIDLDDYCHLVWKHNSGGGLTAGFIYYMRGTPNAARTAWTWSAAVQVDNRTSLNYPDIVAHREGTGWAAHIVASFADAAPQNYVAYVRKAIDSAGTITGNTTMGLITSSYAVNVHTFPSIDFNHTGDGKTVAGGTPHLYVVWSAGKTGAGFGIRFKKATYSAGSWTWGTERELTPNVYTAATYQWMQCLWTGSEAVVGMCAHQGTISQDVLLFYASTDGFATNTQIAYETGSGGMGGWANGMYHGGFSYEASGDLNIVGGNAAGTDTAYRKITRSGPTLGARTHWASEAVVHRSFKRGYSGGYIEWLDTRGSSSLYAVRYERLKVTSPPSVTATDPATPITTGGPNLTIGWAFSQPEGLSQGTYRVRVLNSALTTTYYDSGVLSGTASSLVIDAVAAAIPTDTTGGALVARVDVTASDGQAATDNTAAFDIQWGVVTATILSPTANAVVAVPTITPSWSFSSTRLKTQAHYRLRLAYASSGTDVYDSGWVASSATSAELPYTLTDNSRYTLTVELKNTEGVVG